MACKLNSGIAAVTKFLYDAISPVKPVAKFDGMVASRSTEVEILNIVDVVVNGR